MTLTSPGAILIAGQTASGKSGLAMELAKELNGAVINADSMQVYQELSIITGRPTETEMQAVPHKLFGHVSAAEAYSVGRWVKDIALAIGQCRGEGRRPIIVGGTGLYFKALLEGLSPIPAIPEEVKGYWREKADAGAKALYQILKQRDPVMVAQIDPTDTQRLTRALEVIDATGHSLSYWQKLPDKPVLADEGLIKIVLSPEREALYEKCDQRFDQMLADGALDEVAALREMNLDPALPAMRAIGVPPLLAHLAGQLTREEAVERAKTETRQYAKRQMTWLRGNMMTWKWLERKDMESRTRETLSLVKQ